MPKTHKISAEQAAEIAQLRKKICDTEVDKRLRSVQLRGEGKNNKEISETVEASTDMVSRWVSLYIKGGVEALLPKKKTGRPRNLSFEEELKLLAQFYESAEKGQMIEVSEIKSAYENKVGHSIGGSQIYYVLQRHGWRKVIPRSRHPNKASDEVIATSKKLTLESKN